MNNNTVLARSRSLRCACRGDRHPIFVEVVYIAVCGDVCFVAAVSKHAVRKRGLCYTHTLNNERHLCGNGILKVIVALVYGIYNIVACFPLIISAVHFVSNIGAFIFIVILGASALFLKFDMLYKRPFKLCESFIKFPIFDIYCQLVFCLRDIPLYRIFGAFHAFARRPMIVGGIFERELYLIFADIQPAVIFRIVKAALFGGYCGISGTAGIFKGRFIERGQRHFRRIYGERLFSRGVIFIVGEAGDDQPYLIFAGVSGHILGYCAAACILILPCERYSAALTRGRKVEGAVAPHALRRFGRHGLILVYFSSIIPFVFGQHKIGKNYFRLGDGKGIFQADYSFAVIIFIINFRNAGRDFLIPIAFFRHESYCIRSCIPFAERYNVFYICFRQRNIHRRSVFVIIVECPHNILAGILAAQIIRQRRSYRRRRNKLFADSNIVQLKIKLPYQLFSTAFFICERHICIAKLYCVTTVLIHDSIVIDIESTEQRCSEQLDIIPYTQSKVVGIYRLPGI